ncbi:hypothetical protein LX16_2752 [Stackebrandtia albiflava]|uniref:Uncharacterized protein n=1 Tax=Stackebrandtia albiflava TaxID=406432 RepID=A0A562V2G8_9ACTN|nr:hypothetical protein [Stackebrandtia albiflava]TWJ12007.1 hypothetical protein LX16_2752 [Stackebrandtia albiflava]
MSEPTSDLDERQAYDRAEEHLRLVADVLRPPFGVTPGLRNSLAYHDVNGRPTDLTNVEVNYLLVHPGEAAADRIDDAVAADRAAALLADNSRVFGQLEALWLERGYEVVTRTVDQPHRVLRVRHPDDGFTVALKQGRQGNLWLTASSPPVTRTGGPPPAPALT